VENEMIVMNLWCLFLKEYCIQVWFQCLSLTHTCVCTPIYISTTTCSNIHQKTK
jgi:hypothetical protein